MAIQSNDSAQEVVGGGMKLYSGLTNMNIVMINPTLQELHDNNINFKQDPEYFVEMNGTEYFKLAFWLRNSDITVRMEILMNDTFRISKAGKNQWINNTGNSTWSHIEPSKTINTEEDRGVTGELTFPWWKAEGERKAYTNEETLINFVKAWANVASGDEVYFETMNKIVKGDITEVKALVDALKDNEVRVLLGVKDNKYQEVYKRYFGRVKPQRDDYFVKELNTEFGEFKVDYDKTLEWGPFVPTIEPIQADAPETVEEEADWID